MSDIYAPAAPAAPDPLAPAVPAAPPAADARGRNGIIRDRPEVDDSRAAQVTKMLAEVKKDKAHWAKAFKRMKDDQAFVRKQLPDEGESDQRAKVNVTQRHVQQRVATLYAKNPTFIAQKRKRLDYAIWDGKKASLDQAAMIMDQANQTGQPPPPETVQLLMDIQQAMVRQQMLEKVGETMEVVFRYALEEQQPPFKTQAKATVRRVVVCGVAYLKLHFQRSLTARPEDEAKLHDMTGRLANIERLQADIADGEIDPYCAEVDELKSAMAAMQNPDSQVVREGLVFDFPRSTNVIPDRDVISLTVGFPGARRVSEQFLMSADDIKQVYGVDIGTGYTGYVATDQDYRPSAGKEKRAMVYEIYDRKDGVKYTAVEGYNDFLEEPAAPPLAYISPFFPFFPLSFNPIEDECDVFPDSDVRLLMPIQREINRKREAIRQHRIANRPLNIARKGLLTEADAESLSHHAAHDIIELEGMAENEDINKAFAPFPKPGVDPNLYETATDLSDMQLVVGTQQADLGGTSGDSATENSIAEQAQATSLASCTDDLDEWLTAIARASGQILLREMSLKTVQTIAGPGASWPQLTGQDLAEEVFLEIEAGSSGRPNKDREIANFERLAPTLLQTPGVTPEWFLKQQIKLLDARVDYEEAITAGLPSITAMNAQKQVSTGDPASDPNQQGGQGAQNAEAPPGQAQGSQPGYTSQPAEAAGVGAEAPPGASA